VASCRLTGSSRFGCGGRLCVSTAAEADLLVSAVFVPLGYLVGNLLQGGQWQADLRKAALSIAGNVIFWAAVVFALHSMLASVSGMTHHDLTLAEE